MKTKIKLNHESLLAEHGYNAMTVSIKEIFLGVFLEYFIDMNTLIEYESLIVDGELYGIREW